MSTLCACRERITACCFLFRLSCGFSSAHTPCMTFLCPNWLRSCLIRFINVARFLGVAWLVLLVVQFFVLERSCERNNAADICFRKQGKTQPAVSASTKELPELKHVEGSLSLRPLSQCSICLLRFRSGFRLFFALFMLCLRSVFIARARVCAGLPYNLERALLVLSDWAHQVVFNDDLVEMCA